MTDDRLVERVLRAVELVPPGRVVSYGDVADLIGIGPRQVGRILSQWGSSVPWWRVTNAAGEFPEALLTQAWPHWQDEGITLKPNRRGCSLRAHRADLSAWADAVDPSGRGAELPD